MRDDNVEYIRHFLLDQFAPAVDGYLSQIESQLGAILKRLEASPTGTMLDTLKVFVVDPIP